MVRKQSVIWTGSAYKDLQHIVEYIQEDSMYYAIAFYNDIINKAQTLTIFPHRGRVVPELNNPHMREIFIHNYRLMYQIDDENVFIISIVHDARKLK